MRWSTVATSPLLLLATAELACAQAGPSVWMNPLGEHAPDGAITAMAVFDDDGPGPREPALFFGGEFTHIGETPVNRVARLDADGWSPLAEGIAGDIKAMAVFDDGTGPALFVAACAANMSKASLVSKWDGNGWYLPGAGGDDRIYSIAAFDEDGAGPKPAALFAGGRFTKMNGVPAAGIARWDGHEWTAVGGGFGVQPQAMTVFDDGNGAALYTGGTYGPTAPERKDEWAAGVARWDGESWSVAEPVIDSMVDCLTVFDDGHGPQLYAGGLKVTEGGRSINGVAVWDGAGWTPLGTGLGGDDDEFAFPQAYATAVFDDGSGPALFVLGEFVSAGGVPAARIARWNGTSWAALGTGLGGSMFAGYGALAVYDDGKGRRLFIGSQFQPTADMKTTNFACWGQSRP